MKTDTNGHIRVLVVEDNPELADLYQAFLDDGFAVRTASNGPEALQAADSEIDVVLLDRRVPGMDGDEVARTLRDRGFDQPIAMLTGMAPDEELLELPVDDYLVKPVDRETVVDAVQTLVNRAVFQGESRAFFELAAKREAISSAARDDSVANGGRKRIDRLSELQDDLDETMTKLLADEFMAASRLEVNQEEVETLIAAVMDHRLPESLKELLDEYQSLEAARPPFMWKWVHRLAPENTLPVVDPEYRSRVPVDKTLTILFITLLDDCMEKRGDRATFAELTKIPNPEQHAELDRSDVDTEYVALANRVWQRLHSRLETAPSYDTYADLFRFDLDQAIGAIEYSDIAISDPGLATMVDLERFESHNMVMLAYGDIDLMHSATDHQQLLPDLRAVISTAQLMARIGNWVSTWERELREGDWGSGPVVYAMEEGVVSRAELRRAATDAELRDELVDRIQDHSVEREFLSRWERHYHELRDYDDALPELDLTSFIEGTEEVLRYHLASRGLK